jgi:rhodanese-related sulfurtransferase
MKRSLLQSIGIIIISGALGIGVNAFRAEGIPLMERWQEKVLNEQLTGGLPAVSLKQVKEAHRSGNVLFVDARDPEFFEQAHIPGAVSLPVGEFDSVFPRLEKQIRSAPRVITYCDSASCEMSVELTEKLLLAGLEYVEIFTGGILQWQGAGLPVVGGRN